MTAAQWATICEQQVRKQTHSSLTNLCDSDVLVMLTVISEDVNWENDVPNPIAHPVARHCVVHTS